MLKKMIKCQCQNEWYVNKLHPEYKEFPSLCPWCHGEGEHEITVHLYDYKGSFEVLEWIDVEDEQSDFYYSFICKYCNDNVSMSDYGDTVACKCGRIYRLNISVKVDKSHAGDVDFIIRESIRLDEKFLKEFENENGD